MIMSTTNSLDMYLTMLVTDAPRTFLMPISFVRCSAVKEDNPNIPRQEINIASSVKMVELLIPRYGLFLVIPLKLWPCWAKVQPILNEAI